MIDSEKFWVGADPGGQEKFGIACLSHEGVALTKRVSCADEAVALIEHAPLGVGVDAPLWWSSGISSDRKADQWIRDTHGIPQNTVQAVNSLRGAALAQGAMFVKRLREKFSTVDVRVTEVHPKAVAIALGGWESRQVQKLLCDLDRGKSEHERDAIMAAIAAREGFSGRWKHDLSKHRSGSEQDPKSYWLGPVHYFWPDG